MTARLPYAVARATYAALNDDLANASAAIRAFPDHGTGPMGLTPEATRLSAPYRSACARYEAARTALARFNWDYQKIYKAEIRAERAARDAARLAKLKAST